MWRVVLAAVASLAAASPSRKRADVIQAAPVDADSTSLDELNVTYSPRTGETIDLAKPCVHCYYPDNWHYFRVPKSGSIAIMGPLLRCDNISYHNHGNGCNPQRFCNAKAPEWEGQRSFIVLRDPRDRLPSQCASRIRDSCARCAAPISSHTAP